jgi:hypothetical protein
LFTEQFCFGNYKRSPYFWATLLAKMDWATFWANFSQTHLVTLLSSSVQNHPSFFARVCSATEKGI